MLDRNGRDRALDAADKQRQVVLERRPRDQEVGVRFGTVIGDPEADVLVRVRPAGVDLGEQFLRPGDLLLPPGRRRIPGLLLGQFFQG
jgi:hypothetical protein